MFRCRIIKSIIILDKLSLKCYSFTTEVKFILGGKKKMPIVRISSKCQIMIPKEIRKKFNIKPRKKVLIKEAKDHIETIFLPDSPIKALSGIFKECSGSLADALLKERSEDNKEDEKDGCLIALNRLK